MEKINRERAIEIGQNKEYLSWSHKKRALLALHNDVCFMPIEGIMESIEHCLGRQVQTIEMLNPKKLIDEINKS